MFGAENRLGDFVPVIKRGTWVPTQQTKEFEIGPNQTVAVIPIYLGMHPKASDNHSLGYLELAIPDVSDVDRVEVRMEIYESEHRWREDSCMPELILRVDATLVRPNNDKVVSVSKLYPEREWLNDDDEQIEEMVRRDYFPAADVSTKLHDDVSYRSLLTKDYGIPHDEL
jgi:molecular chaperone DnaK (HSP70)